MAMLSVVTADVYVRPPTTRTTRDVVSVYSLHHGLRGSRLVRGLSCVRVCVCVCIFNFPTINIFVADYADILHTSGPTNGRILSSWI